MSEKFQQDHYKVTPKKEDENNQQYIAGRSARFNTKIRLSSSV